LADRFADETEDVERSDIVGFRTTDGDGFRPVLSEQAVAERARDEFFDDRDAPTDLREFQSDVDSSLGEQLGPSAGLGRDDVTFRASGSDVEVRLTDSGARRRIAAENEGIDTEDIRSVERTRDGGFRPVLTDEARVDRASSEFFEQRREAPTDLREFQSRVDTGLPSPEVALGAVPDEEFRFRAADDGVDVRLSDQGLRQASAASSAAVSADDLVVTGSGEDREVKLAEEAAAENRGGDGDVGFIENAKETVSPVGRMSLSDPEALRARREKEREMFEIAEDFLTADVDSAEDVARVGFFGPAATVGSGADLAGRGLVQAGETVTDFTTPGVGPSVAGEKLSNVPGRFVGGSISFAGVGVSAAGQLPFSATRDVETFLRGGETPTAIEGGAASTVETFGETQVETASEAPVTTGLTLALPAAAGVPGGVRGFRATRGTGGRTVKFSELTSERGAQGDLPQFETSPSAPTRRAVSEVRQRAADQPDVVQSAAGSDSVLFNTSPRPLSRDLTVRKGNSELPGIFTSPDASPLRLSNVRQSRQTSRTFGRGDLSLQPDAVAAFEAPQSRIRGMPESASGSAAAVRRGGEIRETGLSLGEAEAIIQQRGGTRVPDPNTSGFEFLTREAEPATAQVRPTGSRTTELEAIIPPESRFRATERVGVELPSGETVPMDFFRAAEQPVRAGRRGQGEAAAVAASEAVRTRTPLSEVRGQPTFTPTPTASAFSAGNTLSAGRGRTSPESRISSGRESGFSSGRTGIQTTAVSSGFGSQGTTRDLLEGFSSGFEVSEPSPSRAGSRVGSEFDVSPSTFTTSVDATSSGGRFGFGIEFTPTPDPRPRPDLPDLDEDEGPIDPPEYEADDDLFSSGILTGEEAFGRLFDDG
jgi:hypothetical protein